MHAFWVVTAADSLGVFCCIGECSDGCCQHDSVDNVYFRYAGDADFGCVFAYCVLCSLAVVVSSEDSFATMNTYYGRLINILVESE